MLRTSNKGNFFGCTVCPPWCQKTKKKNQAGIGLRALGVFIGHVVRHAMTIVYKTKVMRTKVNFFHKMSLLDAHIFTFQNPGHSFQTWNVRHV